MAREKKEKEKTKRELQTGLVEVKRTLKDADGQTMKDEHGKPMRKSFYGTSKKKANAAGDTFIKKMNDDKEQAVKESMMFETWARRWLESYKSGSVRGITLENTYKSPLEVHIIPYFKDYSLDVIFEIDIKDFFKSKSEYSYSVLSKCLRILKALFRAAVKNGKIDLNPAEDVKLSKSLDDTVGDMRAYTFDQAKIFIEFAKTHKYGAEAIILLKAGVRRAELLALPWESIDLGNNIIKITESVSETADKLEFNPCKTKKSIRDIPFDDELAAVLRSMKRATILKKKRITVIHPYVVSSGYGMNMAPHNWSKRHYGKFKKDFILYCEEHDLDVPALNPHELRHSFGSILYSQGVDIVTISKLMGHANVATTVRLYVHDDMDLKKQAIQKGAKGNMQK